MKLSILLIIAILIALYSCGGDADSKKLPEYGHSSATFQPFVDIMEKMDKDISLLSSQGDADRDFANTMKRYHEAAVEMINAQLNEDTKSEMKIIADRIKTSQEQEIARLDSFLLSGKRGVRTDSFAIIAREPLPVPDNLHMQSEQGSYDVAFATMMIILHRGEVHVANEYMKWASDSKLKKMAQQIIDHRPEEISSLQSWLKDHESLDN